MIIVECCITDGVTGSLKKITSLNLKLKITIAGDCKVYANFFEFQLKYGLKVHVNRLPENESQEISSLILALMRENLSGFQSAQLQRLTRVLKLCKQKMWLL